MGPEAEASEVLAEAHAAFERSEWETARDLFQRALDEEPSAEALDGLGQALYWAGSEVEGIETRAKAFAAYRRQGAMDSAANVAIYLAAEYRLAGNASLANGWLGRAQRLLEDCGDCPARVWLHIELAKRAADPATAEMNAERAVELARRIDDAGLEAAALGHAGTARIERGEIDAGMELLEEALAIATATEGEDPLAICDACCTTLVACDRLGDPRRALDWGRAISEFSRRRRWVPVSSWCRSIYAGFLIATGRWEEAEHELNSALEEESGSTHPHRGPALIRLADLRLRQGRLEDAERLLSGLTDRAAALPVAIGLWLARGDVELAEERLLNALEAAGSPDPAFLALRTRIELARGHHAAAGETAAALAKGAAEQGREDLAAEGVVLAARAARKAGERPDAVEIEAAVRELAALGMVLDEGIARLELAHALAGDRPRLAVEEARVALRLFERLGATRHADEAAGMLRELGSPGRAAPRTGMALTRRESQVLGLLGEGLSNPEIAKRLVISPRTAEHHVRSILSKLDLANRAEAAAYAAREGIEAED